MIDDDNQRDESEGELVSLPLFDDEDEPVGRAQDPAQLDPSDDDVEGHGGWDFDRIE